MERLLVGRVWRPHGVRGELKVIPETDDPDRFAALKQVYLGSRPETAALHRVETVRFQRSRRGVTVVLRLEGIASVDDAERARKQLVFADEADLPPLDTDEVYLHDLIGLDVVTEEGASLGTVSDVLEMPAQLVFVVDRGELPEAMVPDAPDIVLDVDVTQRRLVIRPIEGLFE